MLAFPEEPSGLRHRTPAGLAVAFVVLLAAPAASADVRYASPTGSGTNCTNSTTPCDLATAIGGAANDGDEVIVTRGSPPAPYSVTTSITDPKNLLIRGLAGQPAPEIDLSGNGDVAITKMTSLRHLDLEGTGASAPLLLEGDALASDDLIVRSSGTSPYACFLLAGELLDSVCEATNANAEAIFVQAIDSTVSMMLRNVTAEAAGSGSAAISVYAADTGGGNHGTASIDATNVIARGVATDVRTFAAGGDSATVALDHSNYATVATSGAGSSVTPAGSGTNQTAPPAFAGAGSSDYHELASSPTVNAGANQSADPAFFDPDGNARRLAGTVDIGAFELAPAPPTGRKPVIAYVDPATDKLVFYDAELGHTVPAPDITVPGPIRRFAVSFNGRYVFWAEGNPLKLHLLDRSTGSELPLANIDLYAAPAGLTVSDGGRLAFDNNSNDGAVVYDSATQSFVTTGLAADNHHRQTHLSADGRYLATTCQGNSDPTQVKCAFDDADTDSDTYLQDLSTGQNVPLPPFATLPVQDEEHPCLDGSGSLVGADISEAQQHDVFLVDPRAGGGQLGIGALNSNGEDIKCVLDAAGAYVGREDLGGNFSLFERATGSFITATSTISPPVWFSAPYPPAAGGGGPSGGGGSSGAGGAVAKGSGATLGATHRVSFLTRTATLNRRGRFRFKFLTDPGGAGGVSFSSAKAVRASARRRVLRLGTVRFRAPKTGRVTVTVHLRRRSARKVRRLRKLRVKARVTAGSATSSTVFTLRARSG